AGLEVSPAKIIWAAPRPFPAVYTALVHVAGKTGGPLLFALVNFILLVATIGSGMGSQLGAASLLYGMGKSEALPKRFFAALSTHTRIPHKNVVLVGAIALVGAFTLTYQLGAEMLNFGALIAFMGVNAAAFVRYYLRESEKRMTNFWPPIFGFLTCAFIFTNLGPRAKIV